MKLSAMGGFIIALLISCSMPALQEQTSTIRISIVGETQNPLTISWAVHDHSASQTTVLTNPSANPWTVAYSDIPVDSFGQVYVTASNVHAGLEKLTGVSAVIAPGGWVGSEKTLDIETGTADLSSASVSDYFEDNSGRILPIIDVQNVTVPHQLTIKDNDNQFDPGSWRILSSNYAYFLVWIERDGKTLGISNTYSSLTGDVSFSYGSLMW